MATPTLKRHWLIAGFVAAFSLSLWWAARPDDLPYFLKFGFFMLVVVPLWLRIVDSFIKVKPSETLGVAGYRRRFFAALSFLVLCLVFLYAVKLAKW